jgi:biopolymer transport protein ExbB/TolQ
MDPFFVAFVFTWIAILFLSMRVSLLRRRLDRLEKERTSEQVGKNGS